MKCIKCGTENTNGNKYCYQCGSELIIPNESTIDDTNTTYDNTISTDNTLIDNANPIDNNIGIDNTTSIASVDTVQQSTSISQQKKKHTGLIVTLIITFVAIIIVIVTLVVLKPFEKANNKNGENINSMNSIQTNTNSKTNKNSDDNKINSNSKGKSKIDSIITTFDNYNIDIDMTMEIAGLSTDVIFTGTVDEKNQIEYLKMSMNVLGMDVSSESYTDFKNGITYMSEPITQSWTKETGAESTVNLNNLLKTLKEQKNVEIIDDNHFKVLISNDEVKKILDLNDISSNYITGDIYAEVTTNNNYVEEIKYDFSGLTKEFGKLIVNMKISNYNKAGDVLIPNDIIKSTAEY